MNRGLIVLLLTIGMCSFLQGQLHNDIKLLPGIKAMKTEGYNGSGGKGYWSMKYYDLKGRVIKEQQYKKRKLLGTTAYEYNDQNDEILVVSLYSINHPGRIDTISENSYKYNELNEIIFRTEVIGGSREVTKLMSKDNDHEFQYGVLSYRDGIDSEMSLRTLYTIILNESKQIIKKVELDTQSKNKEITEFEYFENGNLMRRSITRIAGPDSAGIELIKPTYVGMPGSDDMSYEYKYDRNGRIKNVYTNIESEKYLLAKYKYVN